MERPDGRAPDPHQPHACSLLILSALLVMRCSARRIVRINGNPVR